MNNVFCWSRQAALIFCDFQKYEVMAMSVVGGESKKRKSHTNPSYNTKKHIQRTFLISDLLLYIVILFMVKWHGLGHGRMFISSDQWSARWHLSRVKSKDSKMKLRPFLYEQIQSCVTVRVSKQMQLRVLMKKSKLYAINYKWRGMFCMSHSLRR